MRNLIFILALAFSMEAMSQQIVNGVTFPANIKGSKGDLVLNGAGVRKKSFFKVYVLGLYLNKKSSDAQALKNANEEMLVRLEITSSVINEKNMSEAILEGFEKSLNGNTAPLQSKIDASLNSFKGEIKVGDVFEFYYIPSVGVKISKNSKLITTTTGEDFKKALWGIWLGNDPVDANLKKAITGGQ